MSKNKGEVKDKKQEFVDAYAEICKATGFQLFAQPTLIPRDDGTWSIKTQLVVVENPQE